MKHKTKQSAVFENIIVLPSGSTYPYHLFSNCDQVHFHKVIEIGVCIDGMGRCEVDGRCETFKKGDILIAFPFQTHCTFSDVEKGGRCAMSYSYLDPVAVADNSGSKLSAIIKFIESVSLFGVVRKEEYPKIYDMLKHLSCLIDQKDNGYKSEKIYAELILTLICMAETSESLDFKKVKLPEKFLVITETIDYLNKKITGGELPTVEEMAKAAIMPQSSFRRLFGEVMGLSPKQYAIATAIRYACFLLISTKKSVSEIAYATGFNEISTFGRAFHSITGTSPKEFRNKGMQF